MNNTVSTSNTVVIASMLSISILPVHLEGLMENSLLFPEMGLVELSVVHWHYQMILY
jgi:hypothetical protein